MKKLNGYKVFTAFNTLFMLGIIFITAYPVWYVLVASFSDPMALYRAEGLLFWPLKPYSTQAYELVFKNGQIITGFANTLFVLVVGVFINILMTTLGALVLSVKGPMLGTPYAIMIIITMYFGGGLVPTYLNIRDLGLMNTLWSLILSGAIATSNMIIMKSAFSAIPASLTESALLDGASYWQVLIKILIPLSKATIAVLVLYYGVSRWNSWFGASIYLRDPKKYPLQLVMQNILSALNSSGAAGGGADDAVQVAQLMRYALIVVVSTPIMCIYPFIQKYFVKGVMIGAVKG